MNITTWLGILTGIGVLLGAFLIKHTSFAALLNGEAMLVIFVGTIAAVLNAFPWSSIKKVPKYFGILFFGTAKEDVRGLAGEFVQLAQIARREGVLALEGKEFDDPFLKTAVGLMVDGVEPAILESVLEGKIEAMQERHKLGSLLFIQAGTYAPTLGVMGAVIGLISALGNLSDIAVLGESIAAAFMATLFGIFTGYVLWRPFANKLAQMSRDEVDMKRMIITGVLAIQAGESPFVIQERMISYLPSKQRDDVLAEWEGGGK